MHPPFIDHPDIDQTTGNIILDEDWQSSHSTLLTLLLQLRETFYGALNLSDDSGMEAEMADGSRAQNSGAMGSPTRSLGYNSMAAKTAKSSEIRAYALEMQN